MGAHLDALDTHSGFLARFTAEQKVQTNEVGRLWLILPALLATGAPRIELLELGASAGLLLYPDRYRYRYRAGEWGSGGHLLEGEERGAVPAALLSGSFEVVRRRGVDLAPVDVTADEGVQTLRSFIWAGQEDRFARLDAAVEVVRREPPELIAADYVEVLPELLAEPADGLRVVLTSMTTFYLPEERYQQLLSVLARAGRKQPLAWVSLGTRGDGIEGSSLDLTTWPGGETRRLALTDYHLAWLDWLGECPMCDRPWNPRGHAAR